jgi:hypothetical protein
MRKTIIFALVASCAIALALIGAPVQADTLHGFCSTASDCSATTIGGNPVIQFNGSAQFGFYDAGGPQMGTDLIVILSPTQIPNFTVDLGGTASGTATATLFNPGTPWTSAVPKLDSYLNIGSKPENPFSNYSGIDNGASQFFVYTLNIGSVTLNAQGGANPLFTVPGGLGAGDFVLDFLCTGQSCIGTPNSEALDSVGNTSVPEPSSLGFLSLGIVGLLGVARKRVTA